MLDGPQSIFVEMIKHKLVDIISARALPTHRLLESRTATLYPRKSVKAANMIIGRRIASAETPNNAKTG